MAVNKILEAEFATKPHSGDDTAQKMARRMWAPMLVMGLMLVAVALAAGWYSGGKLADVFAPGATGVAHDFGRAQTTMAWAAGINFLGMGFILSSITMTLVNIVRTLRDAGRDVQQAVGAPEALQLAKPWEGKAVPTVMMAGVMILAAGAVLGFVVATKIGSIPARILMQGPGAFGRTDLARWGTVQAFGAWIGGLRFLGLAAVFVSIVLALRVIIRTLRYQSFRLVQLAEVAHIQLARNRRRAEQAAHDEQVRTAAAVEPPIRARTAAGARRARSAS